MQKVIDRVVALVGQNELLRHFFNQELGDKPKPLTERQLTMLVKLLQSLDDKLSDEEAIFRVLCYAHYRINSKTQQFDSEIVSEQEIKTIDRDPVVQIDRHVSEKSGSQVVRISTLVELSGFKLNETAKPRKIHTVLGKVLVRYLPKEQVKSLCHNKAERRYSYRYRASHESIAATKYILERMFAEYGEFSEIEGLSFECLDVKKLNGLIEVFG
ncbi:MAG: hypothetical protein ACRC11_17470 [Xenococcaceae cyanobacterium]